ncbi:MAG: CoA transferase subunit A [Pseudonocardia sp.]|nr:CoA transferase subunit A [Pseudonocardia sp.]
MTDKRLGLAEAAALIPDGTTIAVGGAILRHKPMALLRELVRQGRRDLTLQARLAGLDVDLLVGGGCVSRVESAYQGLGSFGPAPNLRRAVEADTAQVRDVTEGSMIGRFEAAASGLPFYPLRPRPGTDLVDSPDIALIEDPFTGDHVGALRPAVPDVAVIHGCFADEAGNVAHPARHGGDEVDVLIAKAAKKVIVTAEQVVSRSEMARRPHQTYIPRDWVDAVVETPYGAHPGCCDGFYDVDTTALTEYLDAAADPERFRAWLDSHVREPANHLDYLERATTPLAIAALTTPSEA